MNMDCKRPEVKVFSNHPLVSVLMTAYNRNQYIGEAIESVLKSSYTNLELIIVDDCSTDDTVEIAKKYATMDSRVFVYQNKNNIGDYPNRNKAASYAKGKYIKYLDSDNIMYPFGLESMVFSIEKFPNAGYGLLSESCVKQPYPVEVLPSDAYKENFIGCFGYFGRAPDSSIINRSVFERVGGFTGKNMIGDLEMWMKLSKKYSVVKISPYFGWDRVHEGQQKNIDVIMYKKLADSVVRENLYSNDCPMSVADRKIAVCNYKKQYWKNCVMLLLSRKMWLAARLFFHTFKISLFWKA